MFSKLFLGNLGSIKSTPKKLCAGLGSTDGLRAGWHSWTPHRDPSVGVVQDSLLGVEMDISTSGSVLHTLQGAYKKLSEEKFIQ